MEDVLSPSLFMFALQYVIMKVQNRQCVEVALNTKDSDQDHLLGGNKRVL